MCKLVLYVVLLKHIHILANILFMVVSLLIYFMCLQTLGSSLKQALGDMVSRTKKGVSH